MLCAILCFSCVTEDQCRERPDELVEEIEIERLEDTLFSLQSSEEVIKFLNDHPVLKFHFLGSQQYPSDSVLAQYLLDRINNVHIDTLIMEVRDKFSDMSDIKENFRTAFSNLKHYYPEFTTPKIKTMVTGFGSSELFVSDSLIIIGLDYYLGEGAAYRPRDIPNYILRRYEKEYIVPACILLLANQFIREDISDNSMMADMVYYGKKYYFTKKMLPCTPDSLIIWYSGEQLQDVRENQDIVWAHFVENELFFKRSHLVKKKYLDERPKTLEIGTKCPGRIGTWVGWEIVKQYKEENPNVTLRELMNNKDAGEIFAKSGYKPG